MLRRGPGALHKHRIMQQRLHDAGEEIQTNDLSSAKKLCESFKLQLTEFSAKHRDRINRDTTFRQAFFEMCLSIGVDPLAASARPENFQNELNHGKGAKGKNESKSSKKSSGGGGGIFSSLFSSSNSGNSNNTSNTTQSTTANSSNSPRYLTEGDHRFFADLGVQILTLCLNTRSTNGGLLDIDEAVRRLNANRRVKTGQNLITAKDIEQSIKLLESGLQNSSGCSVKEVGRDATTGKIFKVISSVPEELNDDHSVVLAEAASNTDMYKGRFDRDVINGTSGASDGVKKPIHSWSKARLEQAIHFLMREGLVWLDKDPETGEESFWFPSLAMEC